MSEYMHNSSKSAKFSGYQEKHELNQYGNDKLDVAEEAREGHGGEDRGFYGHKSVDGKHRHMAGAKSLPVIGAKMFHASSDHKR